MSLKKLVSTKFASCLSTACQNEGCRVKLDKIQSPHLLVSCVKYKIINNIDQRLCDFLLFVLPSQRPTSLRILELKGGTVGTKEFVRAHDQLQGGALLAESLDSKGEITDFNAHLVKKGIHPMAARMLLNPKYMVTFRGKSKTIRPLTCGDSLPDK
jgi:hypothetical protein